MASVPNSRVSTTKMPCPQCHLSFSSGRLNLHVYIVIVMYLFGEILLHIKRQSVEFMFLPNTNRQPFLAHKEQIVLSIKILHCSTVSSISEYF